MKKFILLLIFGILLFSFVSAVDVEINEQYKLGETALVKVSGNFLEDITKEDIKFYRRHMSTSFADYDVLEVEGDYYIYFVIESGKPAPDNYSINISGVRHMKGAEISTEMISGEFQILNELAEFSLTPGVGLPSESLNILVQNLQESKINISIGSGSYSFKSGEIKKFTFPNQGINETKFVQFSSANQSYLLPMKLIYFNNSVEENATGDNETEGIIINNSVDEDLDDNVIINESVNESEEDGEQVMVNESVNESEEERVDPADVFFEDEETGELVSCAEKEGDVCLASKEVCEGKSVVAKDNNCCLGECVLKKPNDNKKVIGWILIIFLVLFLAWFFGKKYRGTRNTRGLLSRR